ncbi:MAG: hypothetical protein IAE79_11100 [Anaerolinea sp.]|nr:hypothetical protein [Anaerolinea sp.]
MDKDDVRFTLDYTVTLRSLAAGLIEVRVLILDAGRNVDLRGQISAATAQRVLETGAFHVDEVDSPPGWDSDTPVDIILRLRKPFLKHYADAEALYHEMFTDDESPLRHTEAWLLLEALQKTEVPDQPEATVSFGIRTDWGDPLLD